MAHYALCVACCGKRKFCCSLVTALRFMYSLLVAAYDSRSSIIRCRVMSINRCSSSLRVAVLWTRAFMLYSYLCGFLHCCVPVSEGGSKNLAAVKDNLECAHQSWFYRGPDCTGCVARWRVPYIITPLPFFKMAQKKVLGVPTKNTSRIQYKEV